MQISKRGFGLVGLLIILGVLVVAGGGAYWYIQNKPALVVDSTQQIATTTVQTHTQTQTPAPSALNQNLKTYTNSQYGFSLRYPKSVTVNPDCAEGESICRDNPLIVFYEKNTQTSSSFNDGYVAVNATTDPTGVASCVSGGASTTINGIPFAMFSGPPDSGMGQYHNNDTYSTLRGNVCYSISIRESGFSVGPHGVSQAQADLKSIIQSFKFIDVATQSSVSNNSQVTITASPSSGKAPLTVHLYYNLASSTTDVIYFGDNSPAYIFGNDPPYTVTRSCSSITCSVSHTYTTPGLFTANLGFACLKEGSCKQAAQIFATTTITVNQ